MARRKFTTKVIDVAFYYFNGFFTVLLSGGDFYPVLQELSVKINALNKYEQAKLKKLFEDIDEIQQSERHSDPRMAIIEGLIKFVIDEKYFGTRKRLNQEQVSALTRSKNFLDEVKRIRTALGLPEGIDPKDDVLSVPYFRAEGGHEFIDAESKFLLEHQKIKKELDEAKRKFIKKYKLEFISPDWVDWLLLYGQIPPWEPNYNVEKFLAILDDLRKINGVSVTTGEKNFITDTAKQVLGVKGGRPKKKIAAKYWQIKNALSKSTNERRRIKPSSQLNQVLAGQPYMTTIPKGTLGRITKIHSLEKKKYRFVKRHPYLKVKK